MLRNTSGLSIELLENGSVFAIRHGETLVNQVLGSPEGGGLGNVYLRRRTRSGVEHVPIVGPSSTSRFSAAAGGNGARWSGSFDGLDYSCTLRLAPADPTWFWTIEVRNATGRRLAVDGVLAQDLGLAHESAVRSSEAYTSQYIDHTVLYDEALGWLLCSRQNVPQAGATPWVMHGCLTGAAGYLTDGIELHGLESKATNVPGALGRSRLPNRVYQYELALAAVQSRPLTLQAGGSREITFFAAYEPDHPAATGATDADLGRAVLDEFQRLLPSPIGSAPHPVHRGVFDAPVLFPSLDLGRTDLVRWFGAAWRHVERREGRLLSFFHGRERHVVLRAKELASERPTGLILQSGRALFPSDETLSVTAWMFGVFASQVTIGNTSFNKVLSVVRSPLNVLKSSGQRVFIRTERGLELLGVPSAFEMGPRSARWIYQDEQFTVVVRVTVSLDEPVCTLTIDIERGGPAALLVTHDVVLGANEFDLPGQVSIDVPNARVELRPHPDSVIRAAYPEATFFLVSPDGEGIDAIGGSELLREGDAGGGTHVVVRTRPVTHLTLALTGSLLDGASAAQLATACGGASGRGSDAMAALDPEAGPEAGSLVPGLGRGAALRGGSGRRAGDIARLDDVIPWYLHDALVHFTAPHGLEQYSGAAWGVRDVCQGPVELLAATGHPDPIRELLRVVYAHQYRTSGDWPQWFMFDRFHRVQGPSSHADVIHWPIKALCDYIELTGDLAILDERIGWTDDVTHEPTAATDTLLAHVERQVARIEQDCIEGTSLPMFAGGDWEDTLQPADPAMARRLVSSWTVELAYQALTALRGVCERAGAAPLAERLGRLCDRLRADFNMHLLPDGIVAGLAHFGPDGMEYLLHPRDRRTGVSYRLLPMTRGIISGLFTPQQAVRHAELIERHLLFPDGVRLMNRPMEYTGGTARIFIRAETAANFGREIGLQYVHAHLRYIEAMTVLGRAEAAFRGLMAVCPILLEQDVRTALPRQANAYFSSSDAAFADRREASRLFGRIRSGRVGIKGGWRVYSSGPGIFLNKLIAHVLGVRIAWDDVVFDPVLPSDADGLEFDFEYEGRPVTYRYHVSGGGFSPREVRVNGTALAGAGYTDNPYRTGGLRIPKRTFLDALGPDRSVVDVIL
ncbi:MAG TPA: hypothetical protein VGK16_03690 [Candidatus Limnocylindrales bacterium]